jgi:hypothetical protein
MSTTTLSASRNCVRSCACRGATSSKSASDRAATDRAASELQSALLQAVTGLSQLVSQLAAQMGSGRFAIGDAEPWMEQLAPVAAKSRCASSSSPLWDELSVVELRSLLRSYPIDRTSLPAPIELLRRSELIEALNQIQAMNA